MTDSWGSNINGGTRAWSPNRLGAVSAATTPAGQQPAYGSVLDLATAEVDDQNAFGEYVRMLAELRLRQDISLRQAGIDPSANRREWEIASNLEKYGYAMTDDSFSNKGDENEPWYSKLGNEIQTGFREARALTGSGFNFVSSGFDDDVWSYEQYRSAGGQLTQEQWDQLGTRTQSEIARRARVSGTAHDVATTPGVSHTLAGLAKAYQGAATGGQMLMDYRRGLDDYMHGRGGDKLETLLTDVPGWAKQTWKEVGETHSTPGNAIVDNILGPRVSEESLDNLRRNSSWYQMSSFGSEFVVGWYADPGVLATKAGGTAYRMARNELPLNESSRISQAVHQGLAGEDIDAVKSQVAKRYADWRAQRILDGRAGVEAYARNTDFPVFSRLPMFVRRDVDGIAAAKALHIAANSDNPEMLNLTWGALFGQKEALDKIEALKHLAPEELRAYDPNASTFLNAFNATKRRANILQRELDDLAKVPEDGSPFHRWELHTDIKLRQQQLAEAKANLEANQDYMDWLNVMGTKKADPTHPRVGLVRGPEDWAKLDEGQRYPTKNPLRKIYQADQFGFTRTAIKWTRASYLEKAGTVSMHDIDSGVRSIERYFDTLDNILGYRHSEGRFEAMDAWTRAFNSRDTRAGYVALHRMEEEHLIPALAYKLGVSEDAVRVVWDKINSERARTLDGVLSGQGRVYSSAPRLDQRLRDEADTVRLISEPDEEGMVTLEMLQGTHWITGQVHESALAHRHSPVDVTQEVNYYTPADIRDLYLQMKRHEHILQELDADLVHYGMAHIADWHQRLGTTFYNMWKPLQLLRPGWPQRVLMDEGLRAAAIFGPMYWITGEGAHAMGAAAKDMTIWGAQKAIGIPGFVKNKFDLRSYHSWLTDGPLGRYQKSTPDPIKHDAELAAAPKLPLDKFPKLNKSRYDRLSKIATLNSAFSRQFEIELANIEEGNRLLPKLTESGPNNGSWAALQKAQERARAAGEKKDRLLAEIKKTGDPIFNMIDDWAMTTGRVTDKHKGRYLDQPMAFDPVTGKHITHGFFVPLPHLGGVNVGEAFSTTGTLTHRSISMRNIYHWVEQNTELLSRENIRVIVTPEGEMQVGMWFGQASKKAGSPAELLVRVAETQPLDAPNPKMYDLGKGQTHYAIERDNLGQVFEDLNRLYQVETGRELVPGESPAEGVPPVYHGTSALNGLPEQLKHRKDVNSTTGQMLGPGLYTTVDKSVAESYGMDATNVYTIRSSRTGKQYEVFDLDQEMQWEDLSELIFWVRDNWDQVNIDPSYDLDEAIEEIRQAWDTAHQWRYADYRRNYPTPQPRRMRTRPLKGYTRITWANFWEPIFEEVDLNWWLSDYLESRGVGAMTHRGGNGPNQKSHQVYIWLKPEDLEVKPAYLPDGTYHPVEKWFANPASLEKLAPGAHTIANPVPENRLVRFGRTNPALRELHQVHARLEQRRRELTEGYTGEAALKRLGDPEFQRLKENERSRMELMGLIYNRAEDGGVRDEFLPNAFGQNWYAVMDHDAFNRAVNEAQGINADYDWAAAANGNLREQEIAYLAADRRSDIHEFDLDLRNPVHRTLERMKSKYGKGYTTIRDGEGQEHHIPNFGEGHEGEVRMGLTSSSRVMDYISAGHGGALTYARQQAAGHRTYSPPDFNNKRVTTRGTEENRKAIQYFHTWTDMLNDQVGNSPIWQKMNKGWSDERIVNWLDNSPEGNRVRDEMLPVHQSTNLWVNEHRAKLDYYLPSRKLQRLLGSRRLTPEELRRGVHDEDLPDVYGPDLELTKKAPLFRLVDKMWESLGTIPIDRLSRHPFAKANYDQKVRAQVAQYRGKSLGPDDIERIEAVAQRYALEQTRKTLYDLADQTDLTTALRFVAPFWGAQQEALMKWARIVLDRPETMARFFMGQRALYNNFIIVDEDGQEVDRGTRQGQDEGGMFGLGLYHPTDRIVFRVPDAMRHGPLGKALESVGSLRIPIGSANTILQGELPLLPSTGPVVNMPVDQFLRMVSPTDGVTHSEDIWYRWMFPIGRPSPGTEGVLEQILPGWGRRLQDAFGENDDLGHANLKWTVARELRAQAEKDGKPAPSEHDIEKATNYLWALRTMSSWGSPVQVQFAPRHQFWLDEAHRFREQYGQNYFDKFLEKYGEAATSYAISSSNSLAHVPPTNQGMEEWAENAELIRKYPQFGGLIISPDAYTDDYSADAYKAQFDIGLGGSSATKLREVADPAERQAEVERLMGWSEFRKVTAAIDAKLMERGLASIENNGAEDLKAIKADAVGALKDKYPGWTTDYETFSRDIDTKVEQMADFAFNKEFDNRPDFAGLRQYLMIREMATQRLDENYLNGGSRSLQAGENEALKQWFYSQVGQLVQSNPAFAEVYARFLTNDALMNGSG